jgi:hypothetical protein
MEGNIRVPYRNKKYHEFVMVQRHDTHDHDMMTL